MKAKHRRFITYIGLLVIGVGLIHWLFSEKPEKASKHKIDYPSITSVINETKITIQPVQVNESEPTVFSIEMETYENRPILTTPITELFILVSPDGSPSVPIRWKEAIRSQHHKSGLLYFPAISTNPFEVQDQDTQSVPKKSLSEQSKPASETNTNAIQKNRIQLIYFDLEEVEFTWEN